MRVRTTFLSHLKQLKTVKTSGNLLFACEDNLNSLCLLLHRFQMFAFAVQTMRLNDNDAIITISFFKAAFTLDRIRLELVPNWYG